MGIDTLTTSLLEEAQKKAHAIVASAQSSVEKMYGEENAKRALLLKYADEEVRHLLDETKRERIAWARLEAKRILSEAKEEVIRGVLDDFFTLLSKVRKNSAYKDFMCRSLEKAISELKSHGISDFVIYCSKDDKGMLADVKARIVPTLDSFGGIIAESGNGNVRIDLTLEALFETKRDELRSLVYEKLFKVEKKALVQPATKKTVKRE